MIVLSVLSVSVREYMQFLRAEGTTWLGTRGLNIEILSFLSVLLTTSFSASIPYFWVCAGTDTAKTDEIPAPPLQPPVVLGGLS
jgi:hypothetical protein